MKKDSQFCSSGDGVKILKIIHMSAILLVLRLVGISFGILFFIIIALLTGVINLFFIIIILTGGAMAVGAFYIHWKRDVVMITDKGIKVCSGAVGTDIEEIDYDKINTTEIKRSVITDFIPNMEIGTIIIKAATGDIKIKNVDNPAEIMDIISDKI